MQHKDIFNFDHLTISVKKTNITEITNYYKSFGWQIENTIPDKHFSNIIDINLFRPHAIPNKDDLQFLQVEMENTLYKKNKLIKSKHTHSISLGLTLSICLLLSIYFLINSASSTIIFKMIATLLSLSTLFCTPIITIRFKQKEIKLFQKEMIKYNSQLISLCNEAESIIKGESHVENNT